jgi:2-keto-4-pentenoate hydratase
MRVDTAVAEILDAFAQGRSITPFTSRDPAFDMAKAYAVAEGLHKARVARGERPVGRKIGFTNRNMWPEYGVYEPIWGHVYDTTLVQAKGGRAGLPLGRLLEPRIEPEIVLHFARTPPVTRDQAAILACIDWIAHGFEIVQSPFPGWKFKVEDTVAAGGMHGMLVVGEPVPVSDIADCARKLREFRIALARDGAVQSEGVGANVLDSPLLAFAHLAEMLARLPQFGAVGAGEVVTTGTLTAALLVNAGETWSTALSGIELPGLSITFRREDSP